MAAESGTVWLCEFNAESSPQAQGWTAVGSLAANAQKPLPDPIPLKIEFPFSENFSAFSVDEHIREIAIVLVGLGGGNCNGRARWQQPLDAPLRGLALGGDEFGAVEATEPGSEMSSPSISHGGGK